MSGTREPADILVVDDTAENLRLLTRLLSEAGFRARAVGSGGEALAAAAARVPDLVLLDVDMPDLDGYEVCRRLKAMPAMAAIPVIFLSALDQTSDKVEGFAAGAVDFVTKPFQFMEVKVRIEAQLELAQLRRTLEERSRALAESFARLQDVEQLRHDLVHMAAHDMRSPIMSVGGYLELLSEESRDGAARLEFIARAREGVSAILRLVDAMLDLSRLEANRMPLQMRRQPLAPLLDRAIGALGPLAAARIERDPVARSVELYCDAELVARVVANLLANALKHSDEPDTIQLKVEIGDSERVRIVVEDRGPGVPEELRTRLFEKFAAGSGSRARGPSTGLGLAFCRLAVHAQGGEIGYLPPEAGLGARFWVALPWHAPELPPQPE